MEKERLEQQFAFCREIDREKLIGRQTYLADGSRKGMMQNMHGIWRLWQYCSVNMPMRK
jgi:hypothetical protein